MTSSGRFFQCFLRAIEIAENLLCSFGLLIVTAMTFFQVLNRYWLHLEIMWLGDLSLYLFIPFVFLTIALTTREKGHTAVDVFGEKLFKAKPREFALYKITLQLALSESSCCSPNPRTSSLSLRSAIHSTAHW
jgi:TRAP-type C4-dicarboxylate transport system permease small subunit